MTRKQAEALCRWTARKIQPIILVAVLGVFVAFMALSLFVFHSTAAVNALAGAALASLVSLLPGVMNRVEYRLTETRLERRPVNEKKPAPFETVFEVDGVSHVEPIKFGFKFTLELDESRPLRRFWKLNILAGYAGEVHVDPPDRDRVLGAIAELGIPERRRRR